MKIKVLEKTKGCMPEIYKVGEWIDLRAAEDIKLRVPHADTLHRNRLQNGADKVRWVNFDSTLIPLGVAMEIPKGCEAWLVVRSSTFKKFGILQTNSKGIIDLSYSSNKDEWKLPVIATRNAFIPKGERIAQFRICLSQKATMWQKIKWLFSSKIELVKVDSLNNPERGGFGEGTKDKN